MTTAEPDRSAADLLTGVWRQQVGDLLALQGVVERREPDAVHRFRIASRTLRSSLRTFSGLVDGDHPQHLRVELSWAGTPLGSARDAEVVRIWLLDRLAVEPVDGATRARLSNEVQSLLTDAEEESWCTALEMFETRRWDAFRRDAAAFAAGPPWNGHAAGPAAEATRAAMRHDWTKVLRGLAELPEEPSDPELHEVRRRARAARFTAEIAVPVHGKPAGRIQKTARRMQQVLGEHQDTVIAQGVLRRLGSDTRRYGADPFTYGRLQALAEAEAQQARERFARLRSRAERPALRTWLED